jgi:hypothetical protein
LVRYFDWFDKLTTGMLSAGGFDRLTAGKLTTSRSLLRPKKRASQSKQDRCASHFMFFIGFAWWRWL